MKMTRKKLLATLGLVMVMIFVAACSRGGGGEDASPTAAATATPTSVPAADPEPNVGEEEQEDNVEEGDAASENGSITETASDVIDMDGFEFIFCSHWWFEYISNEQTADADGNLPTVTDQVRLFMDTIAELEEKYNATFVYKAYGDAATMADEIQTSIMSGEMPFTIADLPANTTLARGGFTYDQSSISTLDVFDENVFDQFTTKYSVFDGKVTQSSFSFDDGSLGIFFNIDKINEFGLDDPFALYESGNWTFDAFRDIAIAATRVNADGSTFWGIGAGGWLERLSLTSNGAKVVLDLGNGEFMYGLNEPAALESLNWVRGLFLDDKVVGEDADYRIFWQEQNSLFLITYAWFATSFFANEVDFNYGFIPYPRGPSATRQVASLSGGPGRNWIMPRNLDNPEYAGILYYELAAAVSAEMRDIFTNRFYAAGFSEKSMQSQWDLLNNKVIDNGWANFWNENMQAAYNEFNGSGGVTRDPAKEPASTLSAFTDMINAWINDSKANFLE